MSKAPHQKTPKGRSASNADTITDPRFASIQTDPRFRMPSRKQTHVKLDKRFAHMLRDEEFSRKASVDKYGRKLAKGSGRKDLERFYDLDEDDDDEQGSDEGKADDDEEVRRELQRVERNYDPAREGGFSASESSEDESSSDEEEVPDMEEEVLGLPQGQDGQDTGVAMGEVSNRLAVVNLDWDNIRAVDLYAVFSSSCPPNGRIKKVAIYPSEFGRERMEREEMEGPPREIFAAEDDEKDQSLSEEDDAEEEDEKIKKSLVQEDKGEEFNSAKLRHYQLERLRYYYAVMTISSPEAAKALYDSTDGTEFLTTANFFDLRFVPDDVSFDDDRPRDECTSIPEGYKPSSFVTDALQHSKVRLTWDADDNARKDVVKRAFTGSRAAIEENDLKAYLGSDSSDDETGPAAPIANGRPQQHQPKSSKKEAERQRLRAALGLGETSASSRSKAPGGPVGDMQITFSAGLSAKDKGGSVFENGSEREETTVEKYKRKEKERKQRRKERAIATRGEAEVDDDTKPAEQLAASEEDGEDDQGFNDPFFTTGKDDETISKSARKAERLAKRQQRERDEATAAQQRAELELLMLDDEDRRNPTEKIESRSISGLGSRQPGSNALSHFNMNEILRAEKAQKKSRRKNRHDKQHRSPDDIGDEHGDDDQQAGFKLDTSDPRFAAVFSNHEFAIDPTNPRFKETKGMTSLLEEGRKRRLTQDVDGVAQGSENQLGREQKGKKRRRAQDLEKREGDGADMKKLVEKVRRREKRQERSRETDGTATAAVR